MESWRVPRGAPHKGSDTLRVTSSVRNAGLALWGCRCSTETPRAGGKCPPAGLPGPWGQSCCRFFVAQPGWGPLPGSRWTHHFRSSSSLQQGQHPSVVSAFPGLRRDTSRWPQPRVATGGQGLGGLAGRQAFAVQNGLPVVGPGLQPATGGLQLQVLVVAGREEHVLPAGVQLGTCKARREVGSLDNSARCRV